MTLSLAQTVNTKVAKASDTVHDVVYAFDLAVVRGFGFYRHRSPVENEP